MAEINFFFIGLLLITGLVAGVINTLAGGGSNLTLPALMIMGLPADVANATNRVGVFLQCLVGVKGFDNHGLLARHDMMSILIPTLVGGLVGALAASFLPVSWLKPSLLLAMISIALIILLRPDVIAPGPDEVSRNVEGNKLAWLSLFGAGVYGGFVQAGVGFLLIGALAGTLRYDLKRANALKLFCTAAFTLVALVVFIWRGQVEWIPGLILAVGTMTGAKIGVRLALHISHKVMKWFLFIMTLVISAVALAT